MPRLELRSELNAQVLQVLVSPGERVERDQDLVILESMKTEIPVSAPRAGEVVEILVAENDQVRERQVLVVLESSS
jgi:biotin carboxyl carrier protein